MSVLGGPCDIRAGNGNDQAFPGAERHERGSSCIKRGNFRLAEAQEGMARKAGEIPNWIRYFGAI